MIAASCVALATAAPALAQAPELTGRFEGDGWSVGTPDGWLVLVESPLLLGTHAEMLAVVQRGADAPEGGVAVGFFPATVLRELGLPPADSVVGLALAVAAQFNGAQGDPEPLTAFALPAYAISVSVPAEGDTWAIGAKTPTGDLVGLVVNAADMLAVLPLVEAIVASYAPAAG
jgi:hypothetical protein